MNELAAERLKRPEIRIGRIQDGTKLVVRELHIAIQVQRAKIPFRRQRRVFLMRRVTRPNIRLRRGNI